MDKDNLRKAFEKSAEAMGDDVRKLSCLVSNWGPVNTPPASGQKESFIMGQEKRNPYAPGFVDGLWLGVCSSIAIAAYLVGVDELFAFTVAAMIWGWALRCLLIGASLWCLEDMKR